MFLKRLLSFIVIVAASIPLCWSQPAVSKHVLDNGLTILMTPMPSSSKISLYAYVKTGSSTEGELTGSGVSHFVEHMLFKGTKRRGIGQIAKEVKALGGNINASTSLDYTLYTIDIPKGTMAQGIDILSDMLMNAVFDPQEVEKERKVIQGEMRLYNDRPQRRLSQAVFKNVFLQHPYRHPTIGYPALFDAVSRDQLYAYYRTRYIPNNMIISVAGAVDEVTDLELLQKAFAEFKPMNVPFRNLVPEGPQITQRYSEDYYDTPLYRVSMAYQGVSFNDPDVFALDILAMALGQGEGSRLHQEIFKKKKLVLSISANNFTPQDKGVFEIEAEMTKDHLDQVRQAIKGILDDIRRQGLTGHELHKTKQQLLSQLIMSNQVSSSVAERVASNEAMTGDKDFTQHYMEALDHLTNEDIKRVARRYLNDTSLSVTYLKPLSAKSQTVNAADAEAINKVQKIVLKNGLTLLLKEDHVSPVVNFAVSIHGGLRQETESNNGITQLFASVWGRATQKKSYEQIVFDLENKGGSIGAYPGKNTFGLNGYFLTKDLDYGLDVLTQILQQPHFDPVLIKEAQERMSAEIDAQKDDIKALANKALMDTLYVQHPFRLDMLGTKASIAQLNQNTLKEYYAHYVNPKQMVIAVFGDINASRIKDFAEKNWSSWQKPAVQIKSFDEPTITNPRIKTLNVDKEQAMLMMAFLAPTLQDKDRYGMELLSTILGAGLSSRLFVKVRDELGKAYTVGSRYTPGVDTGSIVLFVLTTADKIDTVKEIFKKEIENLKSVPVSDQELKEAKSYLKGTYQMSLDTPGALAGTCALDELYGLGFEHYERFDALVDGIQKDDVKRIARTYLDLNKMAAVTAGQTSPQ